MNLLKKVLLINLLIHVGFFILFGALSLYIKSYADGMGPNAMCSGCIIFIPPYLIGILVLSIPPFSAFASPDSLLAVYVTSAIMYHILILIIGSVVSYFEMRKIKKK
ncbi:MAG: hypothetical protein ACI8Y7_001092 [Candidatus Woesearchaeota archaeon]|jgi:hypothetical protein